MSVQNAILVELFAIVLVLYGLATASYEYTVAEPVYFHIGLYIGVAGMLYAGISGAWSAVNESEG
ncbi:hypothetical protein SAMN06269185_1263 [Natronoarchaeum philippinense]|uniref:Uncharacterized protein n=1 Tax=Natronoarchaeum philippinense TaxID=558529 RepID=A0A285NB75_NATPI|nr:hypothetical protein [Natronoarchaeum philippinense]SNZ06715.1 hypothetical protein SAMN06269185_1263 [Natronoarchaeum philippinense]